MSFHEVRFPTDISRRSSGGPQRRTEVVVLGSGFEERNARWADSRRTFNAGYGVKSLNDLNAVVAFFEERRGRLYGFRWRDRLDWQSCPPEDMPSALDQIIGVGDGASDVFQLLKTYGAVHAPWSREIKKPVQGTALIALAGVEQTAGTDFTVDTSTGQITFAAGNIPGSGVNITAGYAFDVPVRFDADSIEVNLDGFRHGAVPNIPIVEVRL